jgi:hypothetical protein
MRTESITKAGAAFIMGVPLSRITYYAKQGILVPNKIKGKISYKVKDIEAFMLKKERGRLN